ncbi:MAG: serine protease [Chloroflexota bacterium]
MASPIAESWIYATMLIENEWGGGGTGFLVFRAIDDTKGRIFLATNKHVLHEKAEKRRGATRVVLYLNVKNADGSITGQTAKLPLNLDDGSKRWREHPNRDVDVLAFDVTPLLVQYPQIEKRWADYSLFVDREKMEELDITMGDEIVVIGYPLGLRQGATNVPLLRGGIIATRIGETLEDDYRESDGTLRKRILRGFLIDGATIPGSSGSPVVLKPTTGRFVKGNIVMGCPPPILLGIVAETRYAPVRTPVGDIPSFAGLGLAFDAETVRETTELFFQ